MAAEKSKVSSELTELQLMLQERILRKGILISKLKFKQLGIKHKQITEENTEPLLHLQLEIEEARSLTGRSCDNLVSHIYTYLNTMGTKYLMIASWQGLDPFPGEPAEPTEFMTKLFAKMADLKNLETLDISINAHAFDPLLVILQNGHITTLKINCTFYGSESEVRQSENRLFAAIAKSRITTLRFSGRLCFPDDFSKAIRNSWITTLDLTDFPYVPRNVKDFDQRNKNFPVQHLDFLAEKLGASAVTKLLLDKTNNLSISLILHLSDQTWERMHIPIVQEILYSNSLIGSLDGQTDVKQIQQLKNQLMQKHLIKLKSIEQSINDRQITPESKKPRLSFILNMGKEAISLTGQDCDVLINGVYTYLDTLGIVYLTIRSWENLDPAGPTEFISKLFKKIAELRKLETLDINVKVHAFDPLLSILQNGHITNLKIACLFSGSASEIRQSENRLFAAIAQSRLTTLQFSGRLCFPDDFAKAIRNSWVTTLDLTDFPWVPMDVNHFEKTYLHTTRHLDFLAAKLETSAITRLLLDNKLDPSIELIMRLSDNAWERMEIPMVQEILYTNAQIGSDNNLGKVAWLQEVKSKLLGRYLNKLKSILNQCVPTDFNGDLQNIVVQYLLPSQQLGTTQNTENEKDIDKDKSEFGTLTTAFVRTLPSDPGLR